MRKTQEKEFKVSDDESLKVLHTDWQPRAKIKLGMRLLRLVAPLLTDVDVKNVESITPEQVFKTLPLALAAIDDENVIDELLLKVFNTTTVIRDPEGKPSKHECNELVKIDKAFDGATHVMLAVAQWIITEGFANFTFGKDRGESAPST